MAKVGHGECAVANVVVAKVVMANEHMAICRDTIKCGRLRQQMLLRTVCKRSHCPPPPPNLLQPGQRRFVESLGD